MSPECPHQIRWCPLKKDILNAEDKNCMKARISDQTDFQDFIKLFCFHCISVIVSLCLVSAEQGKDKKLETMNSFLV